MNDLEIRGLKDLIKEIIEEETDIKTRLDDLEEDIQELKNPTEPEDDEEPEDELPEEEELEDNPARAEYEEDVEKVKEQVSDGGRVGKDTMNKIQNAPSKKLKPKRNIEDVDEFEKDFNETQDSQIDEL